jgi:RsmE family RNA methyltransferase
VREGAIVRVGVLGGKKGSGEVVALSDDACSLRCRFDEDPPAKLPLTLIVALPRPQTFKKVLEQGTSMGVSSFVFVQTEKVEKSFWSSPSLRPDAVHEHLLLGLEQSSDTVLPSVMFEPDLGAFCSQRLDAIAAGKTALIAHPYDAVSLEPRGGDEPVIAVIGPEGGLTEAEVALFKNKKFTPVSIGSRIVRVETAVVAFAARIFR